MKLLIADDNAKMRAFLRRLCASFATEIRECADGAEATRISGDFQPDWTVMDLAMPEVDGLTAIRNIIAARPRARIVAITQHRGPEFEREARAAGACAFVLKEDLTPLLFLLSQPST